MQAMKNNCIFFKGFATGLLLQFAVGPVFVFIVNIAMQGGLVESLSAVLAVTAVDYLYITLAVFGIGRILENQGRRGILIFLSSSVLIIFGLLMIRKGVYFFNIENVAGEPVLTASESFISAFILTVSSPLTIVFWSGVFTSKAIEYSLDKRGLLIFGISAGLATFIFLGLSVLILSYVKVMVPVTLIQLLNIIVGVVLIGYGVLRVRDFRKKR